MQTFNTNDTDRIFVTSVYYKHGEYEVKSYSLEEFIELMSSTKYCQEPRRRSKNATGILSENLKKMNEDDLFSLAIQLGDENIEEQNGHGIVSIVKGGKIYFGSHR